MGKKSVQLISCAMHSKGNPLGKCFHYITTYINLIGKKFSVLILLLLKLPLPN